MIGFMRNLCVCLLFLVALAAGGACAQQQYAGGSHIVTASQGTLEVNSGFVNNLNVHTFQVYSFLFRPKTAGDTWQQVPIVDNDQSNLKFVVTTSNTADFTLRDAKVLVVSGKFILRVAQMIYKETPYDEDATVVVRSYELRKTADEERWIFKLVSTRDIGSGKTVDEALSMPEASRVDRKQVQK